MIDILKAIAGLAWGLAKATIGIAWAGACLLGALIWKYL